MNPETNTIKNMTGLFKEVYGTSITKLVPECAIITKKIPFREEEKLGNVYHQPLLVTSENGITYAGNRPGKIKLNSSSSASLVDAKIDSSTTYIRGQLSYDLAARACAGGKKSFAKATDLLVENMVESLAKRLELSFLYGRSGLGVIEKVEPSESVDNGEEAVKVTLTKASWSHLWGGLENAELDTYSGQNKMASNVAINTIDMDGHSLVLTGTDKDLKALSADQHIYFRGSFQNEFMGLDGILASRGMLFDVDTRKYSVFRANHYAVNGPLSLAHILTAVNRGVARGLNEKVTCLINPERFTTLAVNEAALRRYDGTKEASNGFETIKFYSSNGEIEIMPHPFVKMGDSFILPLKRLKRIGVSDITMNLPGTPGEIFLHVPDMTCYEMRAYYEQALFIDQPAKCIKLTGITDPKFEEENRVA